MSYAKDYLSFVFGNKKNKRYQLPKAIPWGSLTFEETLMFHALSGSLDHYLKNILIFESLTKQNAFHLFKFLDLVKDESFKERFIATFQSDYEFFTSTVQKRIQFTRNDLNTLLNYNSSDSNEVVVIAALGYNRKKPGKLFIKAIDGQLVGTFPILGMSKRGLDFYFTNGSTPQGLYTINGVMPQADKMREFGQFRRLILDFVHPNNIDETLNNLLPHEFHTHSWWNEGLLAFYLGRSHLRIHGSGTWNWNLFCGHFPFVPTSGCLAAREGFGFSDQNKILDCLMQAQGLERNYENQEKIRAKLIVIEIESK